MDFNSKRIFSSIAGSIKHQRALRFVDRPRRARFLAVDRFFYESHEQVMGIRGATVWSMDYIIHERAAVWSGQHSGMGQDTCSYIAVLHVLRTKLLTSIEKREKNWPSLALRLALGAVSQ